MLSFAHRNKQTPASATTIAPAVCNIKMMLTHKTPQSRCETEREESFEIKSQVSDLTDDTGIREEVSSLVNLKSTKRKHIDTTTSIAQGDDSEEIVFVELLRYAKKRGRIALKPSVENNIKL